MLVSSGMSITAALDAVLVEVRTRGIRSALRRIKEEIAAGSSLWRAVSETGLFDGYMISLIRKGEETGHLSENLNIIALQDAKDRVFKSKIRSAMMYPIFVLVLTTVIGSGIEWFILPRLSTVFAQLDVELPFLTKALIDAGSFLQEYGVFVVPVFLLFVALIIFFLFFFSSFFCSRVVISYTF